MEQHERIKINILTLELTPFPCQAIFLTSAKYLTKRAIADNIALRSLPFFSHFVLQTEIDSNAK
jgi:hypothetical protein